MSFYLDPQPIIPNSRNIISLEEIIANIFANLENFNLINSSLIIEDGALNIYLPSNNNINDIINHVDVNYIAGGLEVTRINFIYNNHLEVVLFPDSEQQITTILPGFLPPENIEPLYDPDQTSLSGALPIELLFNTLK